MPARTQTPHDRDDDCRVIPFPSQAQRGDALNPTGVTAPSGAGKIGSHDAASEVIEALATVSRRIKDLARELNCLGYFEDDNQHRPRAA